jgi:hypothetical protein
MGHKKHGHFIVTIKISDDSTNNDHILTFIDILGFDDKFTYKIMNGETEANTQENASFDEH